MCMSDAVFNKRTETALCTHEIFFFTLDTGPRRSVSLKLSGTRVYTR